MSSGELDVNSSVDDALYSVYEAKRFGELSPHVGKEITELCVLSLSASGQLQVNLRPSEHIEFLEDEFVKYGPQALAKERKHFPEFPSVSTDSSGHGGSGL